MAQTLYLELQPVDGEWFELRWRLGNPRSFESRKLRLADIQPLLAHGELYYYSVQPDLLDVGRKLYRWLDGDERWLGRAIKDCKASPLVLAMDVAENLAHLPWESLHDGNGFLAGRISPKLVPVRWLRASWQAKPPSPSRFSLLFMAASPDNVSPVLNFEQEEAAMLAAMRDLPSEWRVEESGCVAELGKLWQRHGEDRFHVFHLTGHAGHGTQGPVFLTENDTGQRQDCSAEDLYNAFHNRLPRLVFLSGCRTGEAQGDAVSMAEQLARLGVPAVLGWGRPVGDRSATQAAAVLYRNLANGDTLALALAETYRHLLHEAQAPDWHLLRAYAVDGAWGALVEPPGDAPPNPEPPQYQFLDPEYRVRVATPEQFVGRRRALQRCLRELRSPQRSGVLLHGLGGVGKSSLAARLLERLAGYTPLVLYGVVDAANIERAMAAQCTEPRGHDILNEKLPDAQRWAKFLKFGLNESKQLFCFVLDDFEHNLDLDDGKAKLKQEAVEPLRDLLRALRQSGLAHRLIITSRYDFKLGEDDGRLLRQGLDSLKGADLAKKCERLAALHPQATTDAGLRARALSAADGNPRLLEWLDQVLEAGGVDTDALLAAMEAKGKEFREKVLTKALLAQLDEAARELLARLLVYELPVPKEAVAAVCEDSADFDEPLRRTVALGLLERIDMDGEPHYRAPRLLAEVLLPVRMTKKMIEKGRKVLCQVWSETGKFDINRGTEIHYMSMEIHGLKFLANSLGILEIMEQLKKAIDLTNEGNLELLLIRAMTHANQGQIEEAFQLYREALELLEANYNFLPDMSFVHSVQGWRGKILQCYPESLNLTKTSENIQDKATILYIMADIYADQGRWDEAIQLYQKSLERWEAADDIQGIAATKRAIAGISAKQGRTDESLRLYQESLKLWEANGNFPDKAATLDNMGLLMLQADQLDEAKSLFREAVSTWAQCRSWIDLVTALFNLGVAENECGTPRLAQTAWLMLRVVVPLPTYFNVIGKLFIQMSPNNALHTLLSALVTHQLNTDETPWPERPGMEEMRDNMCKVVAHYQGIETQAQFDAWWQQQQLNDPTHVRAELGRHLLALAGGDWLFDRALVEGNS